MTLLLRWGSLIHFVNFLWYRLGRLAAGVGGCVFLATLLSASDVGISEFMALNSGSLRNAEGDTPDWIELHNQGSTPVNLEDWSLTDDPARPAKWRFPATNLPPRGNLLVFASGQDRRLPGAPLHANFSLASGGEYLALTDPSGRVVSEFAPNYPPQVADVSFGPLSDRPSISFIATDSPVRVLVPVEGSLGSQWVAPDFDDSTWRAGINGVGYERAPGDPINYSAMIRTDVGPELFNARGSCYIRIPFVVPDPAVLSGWRLSAIYDDGLVVWLNGQRVAAANNPDLLAWDSVASAQHVDEVALTSVDFPLGDGADLIVPGTNVLAIQGLNVGPGSSDFLILPMLTAQSEATSGRVSGYFARPTPGSANVSGTAALGPLISELRHQPAEPLEDEDLWVTARVAPAFTPVAGVTLHWRVMFSNEVAVVMLDDGLHADGAARDGVFGAAIPAIASLPGQMVRYFVSADDADGHTSRWPLFHDPTGSAQYEGTVVRDLAVMSALPIVQWFVANPAAAETLAGTRCSVFFRGQFFDNVLARIRGGTSLGWPKHSYKIELNEDRHFRLREGWPSVSEFDLNTTYTDKSYVRAVLHYEFQRDAGMPSPETFHTHVRQNGRFFSVALYTEQPDRDFLRRSKLDEQGALYKGGPGSNLESTGSFEKKTRKQETRADLTALINGLKLTGAELENFVFDQVDLPGQVNFMATLCVAQNIDGSDKNYFLYRDTEGSREWRMLPWDLDLSFGPNALNTDTLVYRENYGSHPFIGARPWLLHDGKYNRLLEAVVKSPRAREMVLRRIRTLADGFLASGYFARRIDELVTLLDADVKADRAKWLGNAHFPGATYTLRQANDRIKSEYLARRLPWLTGTTIPAITTSMPASQPSEVKLEFGEIEFHPASSNQLQEFVVLRNPNPFAVELTGWRLAGQIRHAFKPATIIPAGSLLYVSPDVASFRARANGPRGGQGLFVQGNYEGQLSARGGHLVLQDSTGREIASATYPGAPTPAQQFLRLTELMFNPAPFPGDLFAPQDYEFIELRNIGPETLDLTGVRFTEGIEFAFTGSGVTNLAAGGSVFIVRNLAAFTERYGRGFPLAGHYTGALDNSGESLRLVDGTGEVLHDFRFSNVWSRPADGGGRSLVISDFAVAPDAWSLASSWRASDAIHGAAGAFDADADGQSNFQENFAGTDPLDAQSVLRLEITSAGSGELVLRFRAMPQRSYSVLQFDELGSAGRPLHTEPASAVERAVTIAHDASSFAGRFYRVVTPAQP